MTSNYTTKLQSSKQYVTSTKIEYRQQNRIENPEISLCTYGQLIYDKRVKTTQCWQESLQQMVLGKLDSHMLKKNEIRSFLKSIHTKKLKMD